MLHCAVSNAVGCGIRFRRGAGGSAVACRLNACGQTALDIERGVTAQLRFNDILRSRGPGASAPRPPPPPPFCKAASPPRPSSQTRSRFTRAPRPRLSARAAPGVCIVEKANPLVEGNVIARGAASGVLVKALPFPPRRDVAPPCRFCLFPACSLTSVKVACHKLTCARAGRSLGWASSKETPSHATSNNPPHPTASPRLCILARSPPIFVRGAGRRVSRSARARTPWSSATRSPTTTPASSWLTAGAAKSSTTGSQPPHSPWPCRYRIRTPPPPRPSPCARPLVRDAACPISTG